MKNQLLNREGTSLPVARFSTLSYLKFLAKSPSPPPGAGKVFRVDLAAVVSILRTTDFWAPQSSLALIKAA